MDVDVDDEGFKLIQPSLIQQLRKILDEYPDDGQILKVLSTSIAILLFISICFNYWAGNGCLCTWDREKYQTPIPTR